ncbi:DNA polymerase III subunit delta' [Helicobacter sp. MIT 05-5293]|uniref:DNA polymerase III subunit delta' n=1 Tax=Helicobacter sp. MIT 05-5293 TaxID=1548149 RepID=UPI00051D70B4|nr:DNA polymerase III subunit delta' [Helicobacter sp. MIT 05-5293]TLD80248.1 DNA polymerase III subunit delta' [Helicobacter sp. MIT 05-5293]
MLGEIHITHTPQDLIERLTLNLDPENYYIFEREDFKIDDAKEVIAQSYLTIKDDMLIILSANKYNQAAQNALLKITEEPPEKIKFIFIARNKNAFLPTIRSRMRIISHKQYTEIPPFDIDVNKLTLESIYHFCKYNDDHRHTKDEVKIRIESLLYALHNAKIPLNKNELAYFDKAIALNQNDASEKENYIFLPLLLRLLQKQRGRK